MRKLLILALLLYDIVSSATRTYDYDEIDRQSDRRHMLDDRKPWRKKPVKPMESDRWEERGRRRDYDGPRYYDDLDGKGSGSERHVDNNYKRHYDEADKLISLQAKSAEVPAFSDKDTEKKAPSSLNCERPHERYETCFAGCAAVTCDNPKDRLQPCYPFCEAGCVCVHPYVRDDRTHKCVLPDECTRGLKGIPDIGDET